MRASVVDILAIEGQIEECLYRATKAIEEGKFDRANAYTLLVLALQKELERQ